MNSTGQHVSLEMDNNSSQNTQNNTDLDVVDAKNNRIPRAVPEPFDEEDDDDFDDRTLSLDPNQGVDDGFLRPDQRDIDDQPRTRNQIPVVGPTSPRRRRPSVTFSDDGFVDMNGVMTPVPDVNAYQHKKTLAQGMMDLALLSANANQLRYVLETFKNHPYYIPSIIFITLSIIFQVAVGVGLIWNSRYNIKDKREICRANKVNNYTVIGIFIVTVVNVFISAFGVATAPNNVGPA